MKTETIMLIISVTIMTLWTIGGAILFITWIIAGRPNWFSIREVIIMIIVWISMVLVLGSSLFIGGKDEHAK